MKPIDWTHEREWHWSDLQDDYSIAAFPFLLNILKGQLSTIIILVEKNEEVIQLLSQLKMNHDAPQNYCGIPFRSVLLEACRVVSYESLRKLGISNAELDINALPKLRVTQQIRPLRASATTVEKVRLALVEAEKIATEASRVAHENWSKKDGHGNVIDLCGWAYPITNDAHSEVTQALLDLGKATTYGETYRVWLKNPFPTQSISVKEAGAGAAAKYLTQELGQPFYYHSELD